MWRILGACMTQRYTFECGKPQCNASAILFGVLCRRRPVLARVEESEAFLVELPVPSDNRSVLTQNFMTAENKRILD